MKHIVGDYKIKLELEGFPIYHIIIQDKRDNIMHGYGGEFNTKLAANDVKQIEALMTKSAWGKYYLEASFNIVVDEIVIQELNFWTPIYHKHSEIDISDLQKQVANMERRLARMDVFLKDAIYDQLFYNAINQEDESL
jgi:hypothetical protein